ncbi:MAG: PilX N-terminal domain-containing pilus assembly protein [Desulfobacterales bacterium]
MMNMKPILKNENGSAILVALLVLVLLTIIGMSATSNSNTELKITTNSQLYKTAFYAAESGWQELAVQIVQTNPSDSVNLGPKDIADGVSYEVTGVSQNPVYDDGWEATVFIERPFTLTSVGSAPRGASSQIVVGLDKIEKYKQYE